MQQGSSDIYKYIYITSKRSTRSVFPAERIVRSTNSNWLGLGEFGTHMDLRNAIWREGECTDERRLENNYPPGSECNGNESRTGCSRGPLPACHGRGGHTGVHICSDNMPDLTVTQNITMEWNLTLMSVLWGSVEHKTYQGKCRGKIEAPNKIDHPLTIIMVCITVLVTKTCHKLRTHVPKY